MEIKLNKDKLHIIHQVRRNETWKIQKSKKFETISFYKKPVKCIGFSSRTEDNQDILLLDYDNVSLEVVEEDISYLQGNYYLPPAYIFTTGQSIIQGEVIGNYHAIFLCKLKPTQIIEMLKETHCDKNFIDSPLRTIYRSWVLRLSLKGNKKRPRFVKIHENTKSQRLTYPPLGIRHIIISSAHWSLLKKFYPNIPHPTFKGYSKDGLGKVKLQVYETFR